MNDFPETVDATVVEEPAVDPGPSTAVVRRTRRSEVIRPLDTDQLIDSFTAYQQMLPRLLTNDDYQDAGRGKRFVKKSGWRKIATAFDLDVQIIRSEVERDHEGQPCRAEVWARAIAPSGRSMDGDGYCSVDESRFRQESARGKLENDLRATATTRAMNRAISGLVGMGEVSAEEVSAGDGHAATMPAWAEPASAQLAATCRNAIAFLLDGDAATTDALIAKLQQDTDGALVAAVARGLVFAASSVKSLQDLKPQSQPEPEVEEQTLEDVMQLGAYDTGEAQS
jgi:hypothetical protein